MKMINRTLNDPGMDDIDHALGRPEDPMGDVYRNYFFAPKCEVDKDASPYWEKSDRSFNEDLVLFTVNQKGREALRDYLSGDLLPVRSLQSPEATGDSSSGGSSERET